MVVVLWRLPKTNTSKCEEFKSNYVFFRQVNAFLSFSSVFPEMVFFIYIPPEPSLILTSTPNYWAFPLAFHQQSGFKCYQNALQWKGRSFIFKKMVLRCVASGNSRLSLHCCASVLLLFPHTAQALPSHHGYFPSCCIRLSFLSFSSFSHFVHTSQVYINKLVFHRHHWPFSFHQSRYGGLQCFSVMFVKASWW